MKKFFTLIISVVINLSLFAQITTTSVKTPKENIEQTKFDGSRNYLGNDARQYIGEVLYLKGKAESLQEYGYDCFYPNLKSYSKNKFKKTSYKKLAERYFTVEDVLESPDKDKNYYFLKLKANDNGEVLYYKYDIRYEHSFPFISVKYFEKLKESSIGKYYALTGKNWISSTSPMTDMRTGEVVKEFDSGSIWKCIDVTVETRFYTLALILENSFGQQIPLDVNKVGVFANETKLVNSTSSDKLSTKNGLEYIEKKLPAIEGVTIRADGNPVTEKDRIPSYTDSYNLYHIAHTFGLKIEVFTFENTEYILLNDGDYKYYLIKTENWKTDLYKDADNVNVIPVFRTLKYEEIIERPLDELLPLLLSDKNSSSEIALFTKYDTKTEKVYFLSPIFFDVHSFEKSLPKESEYPIKLPDNYYFSISAKDFISFFNSEIKDGTGDIIRSYNYDKFHLVENYDKYDDNTWIHSSAQYVIFSSDSVSLEFYIGKLSSGALSLRMTAKTMGCNKYYDCIETITFINSDNERLAIDIPFKNTNYEYNHASFDVLLKLNHTDSVNLQNLKKILGGKKVEIMLSFSDSYRRSYFINKAKSNELIFMIDSFENMVKDK